MSYFLIILAGWTVVVLASLAWNLIQIKQSILDNARVQARVAYDKDIIYRRWASMHGGVYVPITAVTPSNPYLADVVDRDITTPSGKRLTLMNPAYMTRQAHEIEEQGNGVLGHITSLKPIRPENTPDPWETDALKSFEQGTRESSALALMNGKEYLRLMRPLVTEKSCLTCHAKQGYKEGDIRGGLSISIPMQPLYEIENDQNTTVILAHGLIWLLSTTGIAWGVLQIRKSEAKRIVAEQLLLYERNHDMLTGLYNRAFFEEEMDRLENSRLFPISIILADVDNLKQVNDTQGHAAGDQLIQQTAEVLRQAFRSEDMIARLGGDEFAILLPGINAARTDECIERIRNSLAQYRTLHPESFLDLSLGGATATEKSQMLPEVLRMADDRMYAEKRARKKKT